MFGFSANTSKLDKIIASMSDISLDQAHEMQAINSIRWVWSIMRLSGSGVSGDDVIDILQGNKVDRATISDYDMVMAASAMRERFTDMMDMDIRLNCSELEKLYSELTGIKGADYRQSNMVPEGIHKLPPHSSKVPDLMRSLEIELMSDEHYSTPFDGAVRTMRLILEAWPYERYSEMLAYIALSYELLMGGYPLPTLGISREEYLGYCTQLMNGELKPFTKLLIDNECEECRRDLA